MQKVLDLWKFSFLFCFISIPVYSNAGEDVTVGLNLEALYRQHCSAIVKIKYRHGDNYQIASGFFVSEYGHVLTSIIGGNDFSVETSSGQHLSADKIGEDAITSICLLKVNKGSVSNSFFSLMQQNDWPIMGQDLASFSCKFGLNIAPQKGYVTGFNHRCFDNEWPMTLVRSTLKMDGGDCGGAVIDAKGQLQGMLLHAIEGSNESFFMPLCGLCKIFQDLLVFGRVRYCYIGLNTQAVFDNKHNELHLQVLKVNPTSPADKIGFKESDILLKLNGNQVDSIEAFKNFMFLSAPMDPCSVEILRDNKTIVLDFYLREKM